MPRDDWRYDEEAWEEGEEKEEPPPDKPCPRCLNRMPREAPVCPWCGHRFE